MTLIILCIVFIFTLLFMWIVTRRPNTMPAAGVSPAVNTSLPPTTQPPTAPPSTTQPTTIIKPPVPLLLDRIKNKIFVYKSPGYSARFFSIVADTAGTFYMLGRDMKWNKITIQKSSTDESIVSITHSSNFVSIETITFAASGSDITIKTDIISKDASGNIIIGHSINIPSVVIIKNSDEQPTTLPPGVQRMVVPRVQYPTPISSALTGRVFKLQLIDIDPAPRDAVTLRVTDGKFEKNTSDNVWVPFRDFQISSVTDDEITVGPGAVITRDGPNIIFATTLPILGRIKAGTLVAI